jgi:hypothetical protein
VRRTPLLLLLAAGVAACGGERSAGPGVTLPPRELGPSVKSLPSDGIAVEISGRDRPGLVLVGLSGRVLDRPHLSIDSESQLFRNVLILRNTRTGKRFVVGPLGDLVRYRHDSGYPRLLEPSSDGKCATFARRAESAYQLCGGDASDPTGIEIERGSSRRLVVGVPPNSRPPPLHIGSWRDAYLSPDGKTVLATWSVECEVPTAFFADVASGKLRTITGEKDWRTSAESVGLGWTRSGLAVVQLMEGACGNGFPKPGIYLIDRKTGGHRLVYAVRGAFAVMWRR